MKKRHLVYAIALIVGMGACAASAKKQAEAKPHKNQARNPSELQKTSDKE